MAYKVLLVDNEVENYSRIVEHGKKHRFNYHFFRIDSHVDATEYVLKNSIDLVLLSCSLQNAEKVGMDYIRTLKFQTSTANVLVILCTPNGTVDEHVDGLNMGADDCFHKSLPLELLFSKMNALLRKINKDRNDRNNMLRKFFFLDDSLEVEHNSLRHKLTHKEFIILKTLVQNPNKVFSQEELNKLTSGEEVFVSRRCIDTFITLLRKKIGKDCIVSIRKKGYKLNDKLINAEVASEPGPQ